LRFHVLLILLSVLACEPPLAPVFDYLNIRPLEPIPRVYTEWYAMTEACLDVEGDFDSIEWRVADAITSDFKGDIKHFFGIFHRPNLITMRRDQVFFEKSVRHEMAHHLVPRREIHYDGGRRAICDEGSREEIL